MVGILGTKTSPPVHLFDAADDEAHALIQGEPEAGHALVGDGEPPDSALLEEDRHHAAAAADHVAVADAAEAGRCRRHRQLLWTNSFSAASLVAPYRLTGLTALSVLRAQDLFDPGIQRRVDHVAAAQDIGFDRFHRIVFTGRNLLERCRVDNDIHPVQSRGSGGLYRAHRR